MSDRESRDFIRQIVDEDVRTGKFERGVITRFPPEPNGFLHIGHSSAICLDFDVAAEHGGRTHLRFDDTNPEKEEVRYVEGMMEDIRWLGFDWGDYLFHASDYFGRLYEYAEELIDKGLAYVDSLSGEEIREYRGTVVEVGRNSPHRGRTVTENLDLFRRMRAGEFEDGAHVLRAKIDMANPNMVMRDPVLYRIRHLSHYRAGDEWCIYPLYDFTHCLSDSIEGVTHSLCTLEFVSNREIYDWLLDNLDVPRPQPRQFEFARLNLDYTVVSKRKLLPLVEKGVVAGWDDPRMPTLAGLRRRGYTPEAVRAFARGTGISKVDKRIDVGKLEYAIRSDLNEKAPRVMAVLDPLKVVITNFPESGVDELEAASFPHDVGREGSRMVPFTRELLIERSDFEADPPKGFFRLVPGGEVRLRYGYIIRCEEVVTDGSGEVSELRCTYDPDTRGGTTPDGRKVRGTIHWVSATDHLCAPVRLYDRLFLRADPEDLDEGEDIFSVVNPESLVEVSGARLERSLRDAAPGSHFQFERQGFFFTDPTDSEPGAPVFNRVVTLKDSWAKKRDVPGSDPQAAEGAAGERKATDTPAPVQQKRDFRPSDPEAAVVFDAYIADGLTEPDANVLATDPGLARLFDETAAHSEARKDVANWVINEIPRVLDGRDCAGLPFGGAELAALVGLINDGTVNGRTAREVLVLMASDGGDPAEIIEARGLGRVADTEVLGALIDALIADNSDKAEAYRGGKQGLMGFFVGQVMRSTGGKADAGLVQELLRERLEG
jgi:glutaminyl-tRNA synthetase